MKNDILLYPSLNEELKDKIRFQPRHYTFYYTNKDDEEFELESEAIEPGASLACIKDKEGIWTQDDYNLCIRRKYSLRTFQCLFGENGIACNDAILGLAIQWMSSDSKQRGIIPIGTFSKSDVVFEGEVDYQFGKAQLRGEVDFVTVLYIAKAGNPNEEEMQLANQAGYTLGKLDSYIIKLDGNSSTFPIYEVTEPDQPLWYVKCNWSDPTFDLFSDTVSINLNTAHKNYKYIDREMKCFDAQLLSEIMASALVLIVEKLRVEGELEGIINNNELAQGSVGQAIYYFVEALGWNLETPETTSLCIRKYFDQRM